MRPTTLLLILSASGGNPCRFAEAFQEAARRAARELGRPGLATMDASERTCRRWLDGEQRPRGNAAEVLEHWLGLDLETLLRPLPEPAGVPAPVLRPAAEGAARALDLRFATSRLSLAPGPGVEGQWALDGLRLLEGTRIVVQPYDGTLTREGLRLAESDAEHLAGFTRPLRRALVLGADGARPGGSVHALDAVFARQVTARALPAAGLVIPAAYRVDDLTYALLWALIVIDDALQADDRALQAQEAVLDSLASRPGAAITSDLVPGLSRAGSMWLGSEAGARYLTARIPPGSGPVRMWIAAQTGEQSCGWLLFPARRALLRHLAPGGTALLNLPETSVKDSEPWERILLLLTAALLEHHGQAVRINAEPAGNSVDEFVIAAGRAHLAHWTPGDSRTLGRTETVPDTVTTQPFTDALDHATAHALPAADHPAGRLETLARHLGLDWTWLTGRCRDLHTTGTTGLLRPRSRLTHTGGITDALAHLAGHADNAADHHP
ncbi:serine/threonine-protein kinase [Streptomyces yaizuensis]|uniref:PT domain-containing protein n=1 Tax=Streptomyces yaizuensis TaxID=2989713 RepID=A0ABQ5NXX0_9ACTN|nr:hypothetical protein [Streptomyces sp. YSPA8]GLF95203.1 PT domain-containing protein [Streptomyces sp. YSPA8]